MYLSKFKGIKHIYWFEVIARGINQVRNKHFIFKINSHLTISSKYGTDRSKMEVTIKTTVVF